MLAQSFMAAADLKITEEEHAALVKVLGMLERGDLKYSVWRERPKGQLFNMADFFEEGSCGSIGCIAGWAHVVSGKKIYGTSDGNFNLPVISNELYELYFLSSVQSSSDVREKVTTDQASSALRNYLTRGEARWDEVLAAQF